VDVFRCRGSRVYNTSPDGMRLEITLKRITGKKGGRAGMGRPEVLGGEG